VTPEDVFPEYFVIRVNEFNQLAVTPFEEWLEYLKNEYIRPDTTVPGLMEARERLEYLKMSEEERRIYDHYLDTLIRDTDVMKTKVLEAEIQGHKKGHAEGLAEGHAEGLAEGEAKGRAKERLANAKAQLGNGVLLEMIVKSLHLTDDEATLL
jgi:flagellar biosynthesis/type III secretory pathway protein FliH